MQALLLVASGPPCRLLMVCWRGPSGSSALSSMVSMLHAMPPVGCLQLRLCLSMVRPNFYPHHVGRSFNRRQARPQRGLTPDCCVIRHDSTRMPPARPRPRSTPHAEGRPLFCALFCAGAASFALNAARGTLTIAEQAATAVLRGTQWLTRETALGALNAAQAVANAVLRGAGGQVMVRASTPTLILVWLGGC